MIWDVQQKIRDFTLVQFYKWKFFEKIYYFYGEHAKYFLVWMHQVNEWDLSFPIKLNKPWDIVYYILAGVVLIAMTALNLC